MGVAIALRFTLRYPERIFLRGFFVLKLRQLGVQTSTDRATRDLRRPSPSVGP